MQKTRLQDLDPNLPYIQAVNRYLDDAIEEAPILETTTQLRDKLENIAQQINRFLEFQGKVKQLANEEEKPQRIDITLDDLKLIQEVLPINNNLF
ncbi:MAG: hypothetical protein AAFQ91_26885 [Cyanobacteria bacterium J06621_15]